MADAVARQQVLDDGTVIFDLRGELDLAVNDSLRSLLVDTISRRRPPCVIVNMQHVVFIDSTGMGALVAAHHQATDAGVGFEVRDPAPFVATQLQATGLYDLLVRQTPDAD